MDIRCYRFRLQDSGGESRSRTLRYARFREVAAEVDASVLFLAQQRDDNLETLLFRLMRGSGPLGLAGIPAERALGPRTRILRPMLDLERSEIEAAVRALGLPCVHDPSNMDPAHSPRNRIRLEILPALRRMDPEDRKLEALLREARLLAKSCAHELRGKPLPQAASRSFSISLASTQTLSPWALEEYWIAILARMEQRRPGRALLRFLAQLHLAGCPSRKRVESRGHWSAERLRGRIEVRTGSFAET